MFGVKSEDQRYRFETNISEIVNYAFELKQIQEKPDEFHFKYLNAMSWLLGEAVRANTKELVDFARERKKEWIYKVPKSAAQIASRILGAQMKTMNDGDEYLSISTVNLWENEQMDYFFEKTEEAVRRGVKVNRIFNLCDIDLGRFTNYQKLKKDTGEIVARELARITENVDRHTNLQKRISEKSGGKGSYEVRFFWSEHVESVKLETGFSTSHIMNAKFGLFIKQNTNKYACFRASDTTPPLSEMILHYANENSIERRLFDSMWDKSKAENPFPSKNVSIRRNTHLKSLSPATIDEHSNR